MGHKQYLLELFLASNVLALILALSEAQSWVNLEFAHVLAYILYIEALAKLHKQPELTFFEKSCRC